MDSLTDTMNAEAMETLLVDIALTRRAVARRYARKRWALRKLVAAGIWTPEEAQARKCPMMNLLTKWRMLRALSKEFTIC